MKKVTVVPILFSFLSTTVDMTFGLNRENLKEIHLDSLEKMTENNNNQRSLGISTSTGTSTRLCEEDTQLLDENAMLKSKFQDILTSFTESIAAHFDSYCTSVKTGLDVATQCQVDYSNFDSAQSYISLCEEERGTEYPMSFIMNCKRSGGNGSKSTLEMELLHIPRCVGISCDQGHLYRKTLIHVLEELKGSFGTNDDWKCSFFHDFEALLAAPGRTIEVPTNAPTKQQAPDSGGNAMYQHGKFVSTVVLIAGSLTLLFQ